MLLGRELDSMTRGSQSLSLDLEKTLKVTITVGAAESRYDFQHVCYTLSIHVMSAISNV